MKIIIASDSFKGTLSASQVCEIMAKVIAELVPDAKLKIMPMADGGEGTAEAMLKSVPGQWIPKTVTGPLPDMRVKAGFAWFEHSRTALVEMAKASGLCLLTKDQYNPFKTTTFGTGELIKAAMEQKPQKILLAVGGSATVDGGIGAAKALGWNFLDSKGAEVPPCGEGLEKIARIVPPHNKVFSFESLVLSCNSKFKTHNSKLKPPKAEVLCDVKNPLCGEHGAARIYGPQKGATPEMVEKLEAGLANLAEVVRRQLNCDISNIAGAGAAGGLAAGAMAFMGAKLVSGIKTIINSSNLEDELKNAGWIITGEGCFDRQSLYGKVIAGIVEIAARSNVPVAVIAGQVSLTEQQYRKHGIAAAIACKPQDMPLEVAMKNSRALLRKAAENFVKENLIQKPKCKNQNMS